MVHRPVSAPAVVGAPFDFTDGAATLQLSIDCPNCSSFQGYAVTSGGLLISLEGSALTLPAIGQAMIALTANFPQKTTAAASYNMTEEEFPSGQCMTVTLTTVYLPQLNAPPTAPHCPCWSSPGAGGVCDGYQLPITLTTVALSENNNSSMNGQSSLFGGRAPMMTFQQCINPANFDPEVGVMAMNYCWRRACLPPAFASIPFTASITLNRFSISHMTSGMIFDAVTSAPEEVALAMTGGTREATSGTDNSTVIFMEVLGSGDWGNVTMPSHGLTNLTFTWNVPSDVDDAMAWVELRAVSAVPTSLSPPSAPGSICPCPPDPLVDGVCHEGSTLAMYTLASNTSVTSQKCLASPQYDEYRGVMEVAVCFRWSCLPHEFEGSAYFIGVQNVTSRDVGRMPTGVYHIIIDELKPLRVFTVVDAHPASNVTTSLGPWFSNQNIYVPSPGLASLDVQFYIPDLPWIDGQSVAIQIWQGPQALNSSISLPWTPPQLFPHHPSSPPESFYHFSFPPENNGPAALENSSSTFLTASFNVLKDLSDNEFKATSLIKAESNVSSNITVEISGFLIVVTIQFTDLLNISDCLPASLESFLAELSKSIPLHPFVSYEIVSCAYKYNDSSLVDGSRKLKAMDDDPGFSQASLDSAKSHARTLEQTLLPTPVNPCFTPRISLDIAIFVSPELVVLEDGGLSSLEDKAVLKLLKIFGSQRTCVETPVLGTCIQIQQTLGLRDTYTGSTDVVQQQQQDCQSLFSIVDLPARAMLDMNCIITTQEGVVDIGGEGRSPPFHDSVAPLVPPQPSFSPPKGPSNATVTLRSPSVEFLFPSSPISPLTAAGLPMPPTSPISPMTTVRVLPIPPTSAISPPITVGDFPSPPPPTALSSLVISPSPFPDTPFFQNGSLLAEASTANTVNTASPRLGLQANTVAGVAVGAVLLSLLFCGCVPFLIALAVRRCRHLETNSLPVQNGVQNLTSDELSTSANAYSDQPEGRAHSVIGRRGGSVTVMEETSGRLQNQVAARTPSQDLRAQLWQLNSIFRFALATLNIRRSSRSRHMLQHDVVTAHHLPPDDSHDVLPPDDVATPTHLQIMGAAIGHQEGEEVPVLPGSTNPHRNEVPVGGGTAGGTGLQCAANDHPCQDNFCSLPTRGATPSLQLPPIITQLIPTTSVAFSSYPAATHLHAHTTTLPCRLFMEDNPSYSPMVHMTLSPTSETPSSASSEAQYPGRPRPFTLRCRQGSRMSRFCTAASSSTSPSAAGITCDLTRIYSRNVPNAADTQYTSRLGSLEERSSATLSRQESCASPSTALSQLGDVVLGSEYPHQYRTGPLVLTQGKQRGESRVSCTAPDQENGESAEGLLAGLPSTSALSSGYANVSPSLTNKLPGVKALHSMLVDNSVYSPMAHSTIHLQSSGLGLGLGASSASEWRTSEIPRTAVLLLRSQGNTNIEEEQTCRSRQLASPCGSQPAASCSTTDQKLKVTGAPVAAGIVQTKQVVNESLLLPRSTPLWPLDSIAESLNGRIGSVGHRASAVLSRDVSVEPPFSY
ncbi:hypothetical protein CEUSTIGMA_g5906.t1 [Chlamydomonas eustigma]|uniref:Uncharacterized protein n=1 Tax=Chlamydomonas eustigma TaxID=1157962 RepID=A0A250X5U9_9CHLO|nr:hypothetical protein CEUSTIGMA_g5906.t1 [Chlamydomonas eustigma]|eukprot:GAX78467.1 hypothetical protein CEUSTIGMA_g5906.t1 [Chlamydomonas eustigma]